MYCPIIFLLFECDYKYFVFSVHAARPEYVCKLESSGVEDMLHSVW